MDFDMKLAAQCARSFSVSSGLGCVLSDTKGKAFFTNGLSCKDCKICSLARKPANTCLASQQYGLHESERFGGKFIYFCAMGLTCFTTPILGAHGSEAQLTVGPFLMVDEEDFAAYELNEMQNLTPAQKAAILEEIHRLPYVETNRVTALSDLLFMSVAFINNVSETNRLMESQKSERIQGQISDYILRLKKLDQAAVPPYPYRLERRFLQALAEGEQEDALKLLNELLGHIIFSSGSDAKLIRSRINELLIMMSRTAAEVGENPDLIFEHIRAFQSDDQLANNMEELCLWITKVVRAFTDVLLHDRKARHHDLIHRTMGFIQLHYGEKISLDDMARNVFMSPAYLSRTFKREVGISLIEYLNHVRVEKGKELLDRTEMKLIDVAVQTGFDSQSYFNRIFRQVTGMTPQQYRKRSRQRG